MENIKLREYAKRKGVKLWQIAEALKIGEATMTRKLRKELSRKEMQELRQIVDDIAAVGGAK